jgi:putative alpha-1,2-mannosidase
VLRSLPAIPVAALVVVALSGRQAAPERLTSLVNPFIGTGGHGHTYPGPSLPFGMIQPGPDTRLTGWDGCSGYHYSDSRIFGFSHTHLSGTGIPDYADILLMPTTGEARFNNGADGTPGYSSAFSHDEETAAPGYYAVTLKDYAVRAELTTTTRAGLCAAPPGGRATRSCISPSGSRGRSPRRRPGNRATRARSTSAAAAGRFSSRSGFRR